MSLYCYEIKQFQSISTICFSEGSTQPSFRRANKIFTENHGSKKTRGSNIKESNSLNELLKSAQIYFIENLWITTNILKVKQRKQKFGNNGAGGGGKSTLSSLCWLL